MSTIDFILSSDSKSWTLATVTFILFMLIAALIKTLFKKVHQHQGWDIFHELAPFISNLIYLFGLQVFFVISPTPEKIEKWVSDLIFVVSVFIFFRMLQKTILSAAEWSISKSESSQTLRQGFLPLIKNITALLILFSGGIVILKHFNYDAMSLLTALGVGSLAVGLAAKETLSNMISGFTLIMDRNLRPGDEILANNVVGKVKEIGLRSTQILLVDGNTLIVPNCDLVNTKILNLTSPSLEKLCTVQFRVTLETSFQRVKSISLGILENHRLVRHSEAKTVSLQNLSDGNQLIQVSFWVNQRADLLSMTSYFNETLLERLQNENISLYTPPAGCLRK